MTDSTNTHSAAGGANGNARYASSYGLDDVVQTAVAALSQGPQILSQQTPTTVNANGRKRKATSTPGSRGVANLTPDQLAKKRANDREAQRAIRERTRCTIEGLESRIKELESQQAFQDLQRVVAERDRALAECEELRRRLAAVAGIVGSNSPHVNANDSLNGEFMLEELVRPALLTPEYDIELAALTAQQSPLPPLPQTLPQQTTRGPPYEAQQYLHPDLRSPHSADHDSPMNRTPPASSTYHTEHRKWPVSMGHHPPASQYTPQAGNLTFESHHAHNHALMQQSHGDRLDLNYVLDSTQHIKSGSNASIASNNSPSNSVQRSLQSPAAARTPESAVWTLTPINCSATCPLDSLLGDFMDARRSKLRSGMSKHEVMGPDQPFWAAFHANHAVSEQIQSRHPVSALLIDILSKFPDICRLPEKAAVLYVMFSVLRWQSCPCKDCYDMVPEFSKPTSLSSSSKRTPCGSTISLVTSSPSSTSSLTQPFPTNSIRRANMRSSLVKAPVKFEDFFVPFTTTLSLNWPYRTTRSSCLHPIRPIPWDVKLNPVFESHLRNIDNWSVGTPVPAGPSPSRRGVDADSGLSVLGRMYSNS